MAYKPLIIKSDFDAYCRISKNIKDSDLDIHIRDTQEVEFESWVSNAFYTDLMDNLATKPQLTTLFNEYIKPFLVLGAYYRFLLWHGANVSQYGIRQNNEDTSTEVSDKRRAELMGDVQSKKNAYLNKLKDKLFNDNFTYDSVTYDFYDTYDKRELMPEQNIRQLGQRKLIKKGRGFCGYPKDCW